MISLTRPVLPTHIAGHLTRFQTEINATDYATQCRQGEEIYTKHRQNVPIKQAWELLLSMCVPKNRCMYCGDSAAMDLEHYRPVSVFPSETFQWSNWLAACARCNRLKSNKFDLFDAAGQRYDPRQFPSPKGEAVLINPTLDNPLELLKLDLPTMLFSPRDIPNSLNAIRADYTIEMFGLNENALPEQRQSAYELMYTANLERYFEDKKDLADTLHGLKRLPHPIVFHEMIRQWEDVQELTRLSPSAPRELVWWS